MYSYRTTDSLITALTTGSLYDRKILSISTSMVYHNMTTIEAINEQLDIVFDEILLSNPHLGNERDSLEKCLRIVGCSWKNRLEV